MGASGSGMGASIAAPGPGWQCVRMRRRTFATPLLLVALALIPAAACGGDDDPAVEAGGRAGAATTAASTSAAPATSTTWSRSGFPAANDDIVHGGKTWAVVLAGSRNAEAPALAAAQDTAASAGYVVGATDCDKGAPEALGLPATGIFTVSVYFRTEHDARRALDAFQDRGVEGGAVAQVATYCLD